MRSVSRSTPLTLQPLDLLAIDATQRLTYVRRELDSVSDASQRLRRCCIYPLIDVSERLSGWPHRRCADEATEADVCGAADG